MQTIACILSSLALLSSLSPAAAEPPRRAHVIVVLADNDHQGIVPVPANLGNGLDAERNLYWGARYGLRTFFGAAGWKTLAGERPADGPVLERLLFQSPWRGREVLVLAEAWRGDRMRDALDTYLAMLAGSGAEVTISRPDGRQHLFGRAAELVAFVGHDGLMDTELVASPAWREGTGQREAIVIACLSQTFFAAPLRRAGARPLLWTTGLLAAESYSLEAALQGWGRGETDDAIRMRAARAYAHYQRCSENAARHLFVSGW